MEGKGTATVSNQPSSNHPSQEGKGNAQSDWVSRRFACSLPAIFKTLRLQVEEDVNTRNGLRPKFSPYEFSIADNDEGFTVTLQAKDVRKTVTFHLAEHAIPVRDDRGEPMFEITVSFSDQGECQLNVNKQPLDFWQVRRLALEDLLFHSN